MKSIPVLGALVGVAWYLSTMGGHTLNPTAMGWLAANDWAAHLTGWLFFRNEPWALPLGTIQGLLHPVGTTVGYTDANPWVAVGLKSLSGWLPVYFQFIGPWIALCFALQGVFGAKIMACLTPHPLHRLLGATLFVLAPPLLHRVAHDTLVAHWLLLGLIWLNVRPVDSRRGILAWAFALNLLAAGVHPYLAAMLLPLTLALLVRLSMEAGLAALTAAGLGAAVLVQTAAVFALLGYLGPSVRAVGAGFGFLSADLLTFVNAMDHSRWLPGLPSGPGQYEGFAFLGAGVLGLALTGAGIQIATRTWPGMPRGQRPLVAGAALTAVFALSNQVTMAGETVLTMRGLYEPVTQLAETFRSSGRFIWPFYYVVLTGILAMIVSRRGLTPRAASMLLLAAVLLQGAEVKPGTRPAQGEWPRVQSPVWDTLGPPYRHVVLYPPYYVAAVPTACPPAGGPYQDVLRLVDLAYRKRLTINSAYVARASSADMGAYCQELRTEVTEGRFASDAVYVIVPAEPRTPFLRAGSGLTCATLDGYYVCVSASSDGAFHRRLAAAAVAEREAGG